MIDLEKGRDEPMTVLGALLEPHRYATEVHVLARLGIDPHPAVVEYRALVAERDVARERILARLGIDPHPTKEGTHEHH